jgi:hypothetical protein
MNTTKILHYLALIIGFQASAFFLFFLIAESGANLIEGKTSVIPFMLMMIFTVFGYAYALWKPRTGALIMISGGFIMAIYLLFMGGISEIKMSLIFGLPFIIPGIVFYFIGPKENEPLPN